jgi:signal transduction histidine kinase
MNFTLKVEKLQTLFWRIFLLAAAIPLLAFFFGFFRPRQDGTAWIYLFGVFYILLLLFLFFYLNSVFSRENINKMAEISSIAEDIQAEKLASLETLAGGIAHEINNPLGIILGFTSLLLEKADPDSQLHQDLKKIERQGLNCKRIVDNLLNFTVHRGEKEGRVDLNSTITKLLTVVGPGLQAENIVWECSLAPDLPKGPGTVQKWQQVFLNLIQNSKEAMPSGGHLKIWTAYQENGRKILVGFKDSGQGIPEKNLGRIFDPFYTTKKTGRGIGLGLSITYGIINEFGGLITCDSATGQSPKHPRGTTFIITVPAVEGSDPSEKKREKHGGKDFDRG